MRGVLLGLLLIVSSVYAEDSVIILKDLDAKWLVTPDGPKVCVPVKLVDKATKEIEESTICWDIPRNLMHQMQVNYGEF